MKTISYLNILNTLQKYNLDAISNLKENIYFKNINSIKSSNSEDLTFFSNSKYSNELKYTKAKACLITKQNLNYLPHSCEPIIVKDPYLALASLLPLFDNSKNISNGIISKSVFIHNKSEIGNNVQIDPYSYIDEDTILKENVIIGSNCKIGPGVIISKDCVIHDNVSISNSVIHEGCEIKSGARIGGSGFGFEPSSKKKIYHHGNVIINMKSTIGSNTTIDRAVFDSTIIGKYSQIDNLVQIAHNVEIGDHSIIAAQVGVAGSTIIGDNVMIGGQSGISGHLKIGKNVKIAGKSGVTKNINDNKTVAGFPAKDINDWKKELIKFKKLK